MIDTDNLNLKKKNLVKFNNYGLNKIQLNEMTLNTSPSFCRLQHNQMIV